jgi:erythromycin esterase
MLMGFRTLLPLLAIFCCLGAVGQSDQYRQPQWQKFRSELGEHTIFGLGEEGHGYESVNEAKGVILDFLRQELDVRGVVFESSFTLCALRYLRGDSLAARLRYSLYPFWNTASVKMYLQAFYQTEGRNKPLISGCDIQEDCRFTVLSRYLIDLGLVNKSRSALLASDSILAYYIGKDFSRRGKLTTEEYGILTNNYEAVTTELRTHGTDGVNQKILLRSVGNRLWLCHYLSLNSAKERMYYRDSLMADNVVWLKNVLYPTEKIAIWAANTHISKQKIAGAGPKWMGEWLSSHYKGLYYSIAVQKGLLTNGEMLHQEFSVQFTPGQPQFNAIILLKRLGKISPAEWETPCN